jgi:hypothetical protein
MNTLDNNKLDNNKLDKKNTFYFILFFLRSIT